MNNKKKLFKKLIYIFLFVFLFSISLSYFFYQVIYKDTYTIDGLSMFPIFEDNQNIDVYNYFRGISKLKNNDIVIFKVNHTEQESVYIKRVIGQEGDTVLIKDGKVFVNGIQRDIDVFTDGDIEITLKEKEYFVLGDNREISNDSRNFGVIKEEQIISFKKDN